jgi:hypothetical protein
MTISLDSKAPILIIDAFEVTPTAKKTAFPRPSLDVSFELSNLIQEHFLQVSGLHGPVQFLY